MPSPTIAELLRSSALQLQHSDTARLDVEILLARTLGCDRTAIYARGAETLPAGIRGQFDQHLQQRRAGEPVAYITGEREFWSLALKVNSGTLIPRPDTECLVAAALAHIPVRESLRIADLGTGSGAIALAIAGERPGCHIVATDIDTATLATAEYNRDRHDLDNVELIASDWFTDLGGHLFHIIISNPPYIPDADPHLERGDVRFEPRRALVGGADGLDMIRTIIDSAPDHLCPGGRLFLEHGFDQGDTVRALLRQRGFSSIECIDDLAGHHRGTGAQWQP